MDSLNAIAASPQDTVTAALRNTNAGFERAHVSVASVGDYIALLKPRVMSLVLFTGFVGLVIAPDVLHPFVMLIALLSIALGAGASGALNMWYDADIDALMERTKTRPVPQGRITPEEALAFGMTLAVGSVALLGLATNWLAAALLAFTIVFYALIYTIWLKRRTPQNIVIGGAAGALPPLVGWAAATGSVTLEPALLFVVIFLWTPPHFWALALVKSADYAKAGVPMLPVVAGARATKRQILFYAAALFVSALMPATFGFAGLVYALGALVSGLVFCALALSLWRTLDGSALESQRAMRLFGFSIFYLFFLFAFLLGEEMMGMIALRLV